MASLHLQHGEILTDDAVNMAVPLPGGIYEIGTPVVTGSGPWTVTVPVGPNGFTLWRDAGSATHGRIDMYEAGSLTFTVQPPTAPDIAASNSRIDLLAAGHHWAASSPLGTMTSEMAPYYGTIQGVGSGGLITPPSAPAIPPVLPVGWAAPAPGGATVVLFQVLVPPTGPPVVSIWPASDNRITNFGPLYNEVVTARAGAASLMAALAAIVQLVAPCGTISAFAGAAAPTGYLLCQGQQVSSVTYPNLYNLLGNTFGPLGLALGITTFPLPDLRGAFPMGANPANPLGQSATNSPVGSYIGEATHTLLAAEMPNHTHTYVPSPVQMGESSAGSGGNGAAYPAAAAPTGNTGGGGAHNNIPPYVGVNFIIKY